MKRRAFFGTTLAGLPVTGAFAAPAKARAWDIPTTTLGRTGVKVQVIAQGGARMDLHPDIPSAAEYVRQVYELGVRYFDCARHVLERPVRGSVRPGPAGCPEERLPDVQVRRSHGQGRREGPGDVPASPEDRLPGSLADAQHRESRGHRGRPEARRGHGGVRGREEGGEVPVHRVHRALRSRGARGDAEGVRQVGHGDDAGARGRSRVPELRADRAARRGRAGRRRRRPSRSSARPISCDRSAPATASGMRSASRACRWPSAAAERSGRWRTTSAPSRTSGR